MVLTKRGHAAQAYLNKLQTVKTTDLVAGDLIRHTDFTIGGKMFQYKAKVLEVMPNYSISKSGSTVNGVTVWTETVLTGIRITCPSSDDKTSVFVCAPDSDHLTYRNKESNIALALAYQATLTKQGKERKIKQKEGVL